jgi:hypothetical protein
LATPATARVPLPASAPAWHLWVPTFWLESWLTPITRRPNVTRSPKRSTGTSGRMRPYVEQGQELPPGGVSGYAPMSRLRLELGWASMRWSQRWPMRLLMERIFGKADAIDLPSYKINKSMAP